MDLAPGTEIDRYVVERAIGRGGVAVVYLVRHRDLGTRAALKVLQVPLALVAARLVHEGRIQGRLRHRNVVAVLDLVQVDGAPGLVAEYVPGASLAQLTERHRPSIDEADALARDILAGMAAAHALGLVHRDLKPANVLLDPSDGDPVAKITDFGLGKALALDDGPGDLSQLTAVGAILGTPRYMAPEQVLDPASVDQRADVFAAGAVLFELVTGLNAFDSRSVAQVLARRDAPARRPSGVPARMADAIEAALQPRPDDRPPDGAALLDRWTAGSALAPDPWTPAGRMAAAATTAPADPGWVTGSSGSARRSPPSTDPLPSNPTWTDVPEAPVPALSGPARSGPSRRVAVAAIVVGAAVVAAWAADRAVSTLGAGPGADVSAVARLEAAVLGPADPSPPRLADAALQSRLEDGWTALAGADTARARAELGAVAAAAPDVVAVHLANALAIHLDGDLSASIEAARVAIRADEVHPDASKAPLAGFLQASQRSGTGLVSPSMVGWLETHHDWLAWLYAARYCPLSGEAACARVHAGVARFLPPSPVTALVQARAWLELGRPDRARDAIAEVPAAARPEALREAEAEAALVAGDAARARALFGAIAGSGSGKAGVAADHLVVAARLAGDDPAAERILRERTAADRPVGDRADLLWDDANALTALGRFREALGRLEAWAALESAEGTPLGQVQALSAQGRLHALAGRHDAEVELIETALDLAARRPEVPDPVRSRLASMVVYAEGRRAALAGDREGLARAQKALSQADLPQPALIAGLAVAEGILDQDVDAVRANLPKLQGLSTCETAVIAAEAVRRAGGGRDPALDAALPTCAKNGADRAWAATARVGRAELALAAGDRATAEAELAAYDALWAAPDPDLPAVLRAEVVRKTLSAHATESPR